MKKSNSFSGKGLVTIMLLMSFSVFHQTATAQTLLFVDTPTDTSQMTSGQLSRYNKLTTPGLFSELRVVQFNELASVEQEGILTVNVVGSACGEVTFRAVSVDYNSETDYMWYGQMNPQAGYNCSTVS